MNHEQKESLFGPEPRFSEHKTGDVISFNANGQTRTGTILHVMAPGETVGGIAHGVRYVVETRSKGFPSIVAPGDVIG